MQSRVFLDSRSRMQRYFLFTNIRCNRTEDHLRVDLSESSHENRVQVRGGAGKGRRAEGPRFGRAETREEG